MFHNLKEPIKESLIDLEEKIKKLLEPINIEKTLKDDYFIQNQRKLN